MGKRTDDRIRVQWGEWLNRRFAALINERGRVMSVYEFADYLGEPRQNVDKWLAGKAMPLGASIINIANRLGPEVYDVLEVGRPEMPARGLAEIAHDLIQRMQEIESEDPALVDALLREAEEAIEARRRPAPPTGATSANR